MKGKPCWKINKKFKLINSLSCSYIFYVRVGFKTNLFLCLTWVFLHFQKFRNSFLVFFGQNQVFISGFKSSDLILEHSEQFGRVLFFFFFFEDVFKVSQSLQHLGSYLKISLSEPHRSLYLTNIQSLTQGQLDFYLISFPFCHFPLQSFSNSKKKKKKKPNNKSMLSVSVAMTTRPFSSALMASQQLMGNHKWLNRCGEKRNLWSSPGSPADWRGSEAGGRNNTEARALLFLQKLLLRQNVERESAKLVNASLALV